MSMKPTEKENTTPPPDIATPRLPLSPRKHHGNVSLSPRRAQASPRSHRSSPRNAGTPNKSRDAEAIVDEAPPLKSLFSGVNIDKLLDDEDGEAKKDDLPSSSSASHGPTSSATEDDTQRMFALVSFYELICSIGMAFGGCLYASSTRAEASNKAAVWLILLSA